MSSKSKYDSVESRSVCTRIYQIECKKLINSENSCRLQRNCFKPPTLCRKFVLKNRYFSLIYKRYCYRYVLFICRNLITKICLYKAFKNFRFDVTEVHTSLCLENYCFVV